MSGRKTVTQFQNSLTALLALAVVAFGCDSSSMGTNNTNGSGSGSGNGSAGAPVFKSGNIGPGDSYSYTFDNIGIVDYYCEIHAPDMQGRVSISSDAETGGQDTVEMRSAQFVPSQITVKPNTEVVWINRDNSNHTVVEGNPSTGGNDDDGVY